MTSLAREETVTLRGAKQPQPLLSFLSSPLDYRTVLVAKQTEGHNEKDVGLGGSSENRIWVLAFPPSY